MHGYVNNMSDLMFLSLPNNVLVQDLGNDETILRGYKWYDR